jgi:hypothetical protein
VTDVVRIVLPNVDGPDVVRIVLANVDGPVETWTTESVQVSLQGPPGATGPAGPSLTADPDTADGSFATWDADTQTVVFVPATTVMRTGVGTDFDDATPHAAPLSFGVDVSTAPSLNSLIDAGSYYFADGISATDAPPGADPSQPYVLAVTSSPAPGALPPDWNSDGQPEPPGTYQQGGIQILTLRSDPTVVYRRGFTATPTDFTPWIRSGVGAVSYRHVQSNAATLWTVPHPLLFRPAVTCTDSTGRIIWPDDVSYPNTATVLITFSPAVGGEAALS